MRLKAITLFVGLLAAAALIADNTPSKTTKPAVSEKTASAPETSTFATAVQPILGKSCAPCHNDRLASGGLNIGPYLAPGSIVEQREEWGRIIQKIRTGEMPPQGMPKLSLPQIETLMGFVHSEFEKADRNIKADPGRVTARRLNRAEYSNTIRDLLAVDFRAEQDFPTDD
ncbi:MAG: DUF1587 domain-containing protein, partial [Bryobacteraceae bacterium]